jgi:hypothetical protein
MYSLQELIPFKDGQKGLRPWGVGRKGSNPELSQNKWGLGYFKLGNS